MQEHAEKIELNRQSIELMKNQFAVELAQIKEDHKTIIVSLSSLQPVLDAYKKGMTIKSKLGTIAIAYIVLQFVFSRISHDQLVELIKMAL